jgi:endonuclease YncB( thermonuclease family)|tara:strand:+ start:446 stop:1126 length:681 start_codon:yes stop_codon:yes gene_type:complete
MGFLNNTNITVDAVLTKKGRELLAKGENQFNITKFALADDEVDYRLWDVTHPNGSDYYGTVIESMPLLEAFPDENHVMRYKLVTLPKSTQAMPILEVAQSAVRLRRLNSVSVINPSTQNGSDDTLGYTFILHNQSLARLRVRAGAQTSATGTTVPFFLDEDDLPNSTSVVGKSVEIRPKRLTRTQTTQLTIVGNETAATTTINITVNRNRTFGAASAANPPQGFLP